MAPKAFQAGPLAAICAASSMLLAGCASSLSPFVLGIANYRPDWRSEATITTAEVCYNRATTTAEAVKQLAEEACVNQGAHAVFAEHRFLQCSLAQPVSAVFVCRRGPDGAATGVQAPARRSPTVSPTRK